MDGLSVPEEFCGLRSCSAKAVVEPPGLQFGLLVFLSHGVAVGAASRLLFFSFSQVYMDKKTCIAAPKETARFKSSCLWIFLWNPKEPHEGMACSHLLPQMVMPRKMQGQSKR